MNEVLPCQNMTVLGAVDMTDVHEVEQFDDEDAIAGMLTNLR